MRVAMAILLAAAFASPAFGHSPKPKMCGVYVKYACGSSAPAKKAKSKVCGVYVKYSC